MELDGNWRMLVEIVVKVPDLLGEVYARMLPQCVRFATPECLIDNPNECVDRRSY